MPEIDGVIQSVAFYYGEFDNLLSFTLETLDGVPLDAVFNWEYPNSSFRHFVTRAAHLKEGTVVRVELPPGISIKTVQCNPLDNEVDIKKFKVIGPIKTPSAGQAGTQAQPDA